MTSYGYVHSPRIVLDTITAKFVQAHLHVEGILQDVKTHWTMKKLLDLPEKVELQIILIIINDLSRLAYDLVEIQVIYNIWLEFENE